MHSGLHKPEESNTDKKDNEGSLSDSDKTPMETKSLLIKVI